VRTRALALACAALCLFGPAAVAQRAAPDTSSVVRPVPRASWLSDERAFAVGEILTVVVDEQTVASEKMTASQNSTRNEQNDISLSASSKSAPTAATFASQAAAVSQQTGSSDRQGQLTATLSVRVTHINADGSLKIEGKRDVVMDGRRQQMTLTGFVRPQDVSPQNVVPSSRIANASISYKGNGMSPHHGIIGWILGLFWP
jgi:flagellar L-ring protein precursor FlgH